MTISQLPFPKGIGFKYVKDYTLQETLIVGTKFNAHTVPAGTTVEIWQGTNFGYVCLPPKHKAPWGQTIFRY